MNDTPKRYKDEREAESRRILASVNDEMQVSGLANRVGDHFAGRDGDGADKVEVLGRRIGRALSVVLCLGLIFWLVMMISGNTN